MLSFSLSALSSSSPLSVSSDSACSALRLLALSFELSDLRLPLIGLLAADPRLADPREPLDALPELAERPWDFLPLDFWERGEEPLPLVRLDEPEPEEPRAAEREEAPPLERPADLRPKEPAREDEDAEACEPDARRAPDLLLFGCAARLLREPEESELGL